MPPTSLPLRDYQTRCLEAVSAGREQYRRQLVVMSTGSGKTVTFAHAAKRAVDGGGKVLILAHRNELIDQAIDKVHRATGLWCGKEKAGQVASFDDRVVVASVQTLSGERRLSSWPRDHFGLVVVDEAHRSTAESYRKVLDHFDAPVLGVTATADRGDKRSLAEVFENVPFEYNLIDAVRDGWLVRPLVKTVPIELDMRGVKSSQTADGYDYSPEEVGNRLEPLLEMMCARLVVEIGRRRTFVYLPSVALSEKAAEITRAHGVSCQSISGYDADRNQRMQRIYDDRVQVTFNAQLLTEGTDADHVSCVSIWRPTKIRSLLAQCAGRATRPLEEIVPALNAAPDAAVRRRLIRESAKPDMVILDYLWLTDRLDLVRPADLVVGNSQVAEYARKMDQQGDLLEIGETAMRDYLKTLEEAVRKNARKRARVIDPLAFAVMVGDDELETYEPSSRWEMKAPSESQSKLLVQFGIDPARVSCCGLASRVLDKLIKRRKMGLCSVQQINFLGRLGVREVALLSHADAKVRIDARLAELRARNPRPAKPEPQMELLNVGPVDGVDVPD